MNVGTSVTVLLTEVAPVHESVKVVAEVIGPVATLAPVHVGLVSTGIVRLNTLAGTEVMLQAEPSPLESPTTLQERLTGEPLRTRDAEAVRVNPAGPLATQLPPCKAYPSLHAVQEPAGPEPLGHGKTQLPPLKTYPSLHDKHAPSGPLPLGQVWTVTVVLAETLPPAAIVHISS